MTKHHKSEKNETLEVLFELAELNSAFENGVLHSSNTFLLHWMHKDGIWQSDKMQLDIDKTTISDLIFTPSHRFTVHSALRAFNDINHELIDLEIDISNSKFNLSNGNEDDSSQNEI